MYYVIQKVILGWNKNNDCLISKYSKYLMHKQHNVRPFKWIVTTLASFYSDDDMLAAKLLSHL